jgi:hypothetical protein
MAGKTLPENKTGKGGGQYNNKNAEKWTEEKALELANELIEWMRPKLEQREIKGELRTIDVNQYNFYYSYFLLIHKRYCINTIKYLEDKYKSFREAIKTAHKMQELKLSEAGIKNRINPAFGIFMLKAKHGLQDRIDVTSDGEKLTGITLNIVNNKTDIKEDDTIKNKVDE